jgi:hypothetical protein
MAALAASSCDNGCSGHGVCECSQCLCYDNWGMGYDLDTGDCSDRICPFEFAWVDTPDDQGRFHKYAECAGRGICNRGTGECECFEGYEGKGCQRTTCPNDCSGHGTCEYIQNLGNANFPFDGATGVSLNSALTAATSYFTEDPRTFDMYDWDKRKTRGCVCDPEYGDVDCSKRMCNFGDDKMDKRVQYHSGEGTNQIQTISFNHEDTVTGLATISGATFALTFKTKLNETFTTSPISFTTANSGATLASSIADALVRLPNRVIDGVTVTAANAATSRLDIRVEFTGDYVQGAQNILVVQDLKCGAGCTPLISGLNGLTLGQQVVIETTASDFNSFECGRRGKCDYDTGVCQCFAGFTGPSCNSCTAMI